MMVQTTTESGKKNEQPEEEGKNVQAVLSAEPNPHLLDSYLMISNILSDLSTGEKKKTYEDELYRIEGRINEVGDRLKHIKGEKERLEESSKEYSYLEKERCELRKELIGLDYNHSQIMIKYKEVIKEEQA